MKESNKTLYKNALTPDCFEKLLEKIKDFSIISLFLKDFLAANKNSSNSYEYSYYSYSQSKKNDYQKIVKILEEKIKKIENENQMDMIFYSEIYNDVLNLKKNLEKPTNEFINSLQNTRAKIKILITNLIEPIQDQITSKDILCEVIFLHH